MYRSSVSPNAVPSPLRNVRLTRSAIVRWNGTVVLALAFVAVIVRSKFPRGEAGVVFTRKVESNRATPVAGVKAHVVSAGHPDTVKVTGSADVPGSRRTVDALLFLAVWMDEVSG